MASRAAGGARLAASFCHGLLRPQPAPAQRRSPPSLGAAAAPAAARSLSATTASRGPKPVVTKPEAKTQALPLTRWTSGVRSRVGRCLAFGCDAAQVRRAAAILATLVREWRVLTVGSEGFLAGERRGLEDQQVVWGEMDSFVGPLLFFFFFFFPLLFSFLSLFLLDAGDRIRVQTGS